MSSFLRNRKIDPLSTIKWLERLMIIQAPSTHNQGNSTHSPVISQHYLNSLLPCACYICFWMQLLKSQIIVYKERKKKYQLGTDRFGRWKKKNNSSALNDLVGRKKITSSALIDW